MLKSLGVFFSHASEFRGLEFSLAQGSMSLKRTLSLKQEVKLMNIILLGIYLKQHFFPYSSKEM